MKNLIVTFLIILIANISSAQSGWGYVNYTSYKTHAGYGATNQYQAFPYTAAEFDNMLNTANSNTTITATGEVPLSYIYNGSTQTPHWGGDFYAIKFDFWFVPQQTGTYYFGINSDDASDLSIDGVIIATYYGGHGASGYQTGSKNMIAGQKYKVVVRYQEYGGGDALYFRWYRPVGGWGYWNNEVTNIGNEPTKKGRMNFDFGSTLDKTKFSIGSSLSSTGWIDITNSLDSNKIATGNKATIATGQAEYSYVNMSNNINTLYIDLTRFGNTQPSSINQVKILDVYDGPVTYLSSDIYWAHYRISSSLPKVTDGTSIHSQYIRNAGYDNHAFLCDISFASVMEYKPQSVTVTTSNTLSTLYNSIVTVSDVYLAFKELANGGLFGNQTGNEFTYGVQYKNADINDDNVFNEADCFALLQHLTGVKNLVDTFNLRKTMKLIPQATYNSIGKSNWNTFSSYLGDTYNFDINTGKAIDTLNISATWKGDVNLSHSATPASNGITTNSLKTSMVKSMAISNEINASILTEIVGDSIYAYVSLDSLSQNVVGTQFQLNYDNSILNFGKVTFKTKGNPTNYATNKGSYISLGSLISDGSSFLDNTTEYKISFSSNSKLMNVLGLISVEGIDAVSQTGTQLKIKVN